MASPKDVVKMQLDQGSGLFEGFTKDLSDEEFFKPAVPDGNHTAWLIGHVATSEVEMLSAITGKEPETPENLSELFRGGAPCNQDPAAYPARHEIDELMKSTRANTNKILATFDDTRWDEESPDTPFKDMFPTLGSIFALTALHQFWHLGQIADNRRALNKAPIFNM